MEDRDEDFFGETMTAHDADDRLGKRFYERRIRFPSSRGTPAREGCVARLSLSHRERRCFLALFPFFSCFRGTSVGACFQGNCCGFFLYYSTLAVLVIITHECCLSFFLPLPISRSSLPLTRRSSPAVNQFLSLSLSLALVVLERDCS